MLFQDVSKDRELSQLRDDFTGMLVHDLRAPLTAIMNGIAMIQRGLGGPVSEQQQELLKISYQSSQTMLEMINTLLDISKMEQGGIPINYEPISAYALVDEPLGRLQANAEGNGVQLAQQLPLNLPLIEADREKIVRVLQNLLDNAIKFSPVGGTVTIGAAACRYDTEGHICSPTTQNDKLPVTIPVEGVGEWVVFWVQDQGMGIPADYHSRIFEKFGQVRGRKVRGTGLGLTFSKLAVESHGGQIWVESARRHLPVHSCAVRSACARACAPSTIPPGTGSTA
jgi:signal transduction histidine kinase